MKKAIKIVKESVFMLLVGVISGGVILILSVVIGLFCKDMLKGVSVARSILLLISGITLLFSAVQFLKGGNLPKDSFSLLPHKKDADIEEQEEILKFVSKRWGSMLVAFGFLSMATLADWIQYICI